MSKTFGDSSVGRRPGAPVFDNAHTSFDVQSRSRSLPVQINEELRHLLDDKMGRFGKSDLSSILTNASRCAIAWSAAMDETKDDVDYAVNFEPSELYGVKTDYEWVVRVASAVYNAAVNGNRRAAGVLMDVYKSSCKDEFNVDHVDHFTYNAAMAVMRDYGIKHCYIRNVNIERLVYILYDAIQQAHEDAGVLSEAN